MAIICPSPLIFPGTGIWPAMSLSAPLNPLRLSGRVTGSNIQDDSGPGFGGTVA